VKLHALLACLIVSSTASAAPAKVHVSTKLRDVEIKDDALGIVVFRMQVPDDWKFEGALLRDPVCGGLPVVTYRITSADGLAGYQVLPQFGWHWSDEPTYLAVYRKFKCKVMQPMSPADFLHYILPAIRPDPVAGPIQPTVDAQQIDQMIAAYNARVKQTRMAGGESGGGVHSRVKYTFHGQAVEENVRVVVTTFQQPAGLGKWSWNSTADVATTRAPDGQLDEVTKQLAPIFSKGGYTQEWQQRISKALADDNARAMAQIKKTGQETAVRMKAQHDAYMKESQQRFDRSQAAAREHQDAQRRSALAYTLYAGDEQLVRNPQSGEMTRVSNQYGTNAHQDNISGDIVISNDPDYDPSYYERGQWTQLENVNPLQK
jgi:hypothetical protein